MADAADGQTGVVFLDVDGVVSQRGLVPALLETLRTLFERSVAELALPLRIVVSSSWRSSPAKLRKLREALEKHGMPPFEPTDVTPTHERWFVPVD